MSVSNEKGKSLEDEVAKILKKKLACSPARQGDVPLSHTCDQKVNFDIGGPSFAEPDPASASRHDSAPEKHDDLMQAKDLQWTVPHRRPCPKVTTLHNA